MTYIAIAIVSLFVVSNMPRIMLGFQEVVNTRTIIDCIEKDVQYIPSLTFFKVDSVARLLMIVNSSVNFLVYCAGSTAFQVSHTKNFFFFFSLNAKESRKPYLTLSEKKVCVG